MGESMGEEQKASETKSMNPFWKCGGCGNTVQAPAAPETCPSCKEKCVFKDVTCYTPDCGGPGNIDPRL
jgi:rubrerythrin